MPQTTTALLPAAQARLASFAARCPDRITRITATEVVVRAKPGHVNSPQLTPTDFDLWDHVPKWVIEVRTAGGLVGYGETPRGTDDQDIRWCAGQMVDRPVSQFGLVNPLPLPPGGMGQPAPNHARAPDISGGGIGMSVALHDLIAKAAGVPLTEVLGVPVRSAVCTSWWCGRTDPDHVVQRLRAGQALGYRDLKIKATTEDDIVGIVRAFVKAAAPPARIMVDPNRRFQTLEATLDILREIGPCPQLVLEDPYPFEPAGWARLRREFPVPLALHTVGVPAEALAAGACDFINLPYPLGTLLRGADSIAPFGAPCWVGTGVELGILNAYLMHAAAVIPHCTLPSDTFGHDVREDDLIVERLITHGGMTPLPEGAGLGVTLDPQAVARHGKRQLVFGA